MCGRTIDGEVSTFGTTGYTRNNVFVLYDRVTDSLWHPLEDGRFDAVAGKNMGDQIPFLQKPSPVSLGEWVSAHPDTLVLLPPPDRRGFLGVRLDLTEPVIEEVFPGTAAARAGLHPGDRIIRIGKTAMTQRSDVTDVLRNKRAKDRLVVVILRESQELTVEVELQFRSERL